MSSVFISCDWGTTNLRVRKVEMETGRILSQVSNHHGIAYAHNEWQKQPDSDRFDFYFEILETLISQLDPEIDSRIPAVISGMASSTIGLKELPYSEIPIDSTGEDLVRETLTSPTTQRPVWLISGIRYKDDVIRGEETQVVGLAQLGNYELGNTTVIFPGTHSKHLLLLDRQITRFRTFVTGELFAIIRRHSILGKSLIAPGPEMSDSHRDAFAEGVTQSQIGGITGSFFKVRTNQLFDRYSPDQNYYYLSGLLLGAELESLPNSGDILIGGEGAIRELYRLGVEILGGKDRCFTLSEEEAHQITPLGHRSLLQRILS